MSTHQDKVKDSQVEDLDMEEVNREESTRSSEQEVDRDTTVTPVAGAWAALATGDSVTVAVTGLLGSLPPKFQGLATPEKNPMSLQMSREDLVVGCADGTIYVMNFVGYEYQKEREVAHEPEESANSE